jgi:hypothetical protein
MRNDSEEELTEHEDQSWPQGFSHRRGRSERRVISGVRASATGANRHNSS